jgi:RNase H-fold protein (predicted Holliday junction resolvase)
MILGIDPGTQKCGYAVLACLGDRPVDLGISPLATFTACLDRLRATHDIGFVAVGGGTNAEAIVPLIEAAGLPYALVDERETTLQARARFFVDHPPRGWRRLIPRGMLLPDRPIDDYAALLIAERYLRRPA